MTAPGEGVGLKVEDLHAGYGGMEVVSDVSLEVNPGEIVALVGRNGAGKTTTLAAIAGMRRGEFTGRVMLDKTDLARLRPAQIVAAGLAFVPAGHRVFTALTVLENLRLGAFSRRRRISPQALTAGLERTFDQFPVLSAYQTRMAGHLSGGEQQMLAIAQALMSEPGVLLLDEPTSGLAPTVVQTIYAALANLRDARIGVLVVEQSVERAVDRSDRCYVMERGNIELSGRASEIAADERVQMIVRGVASPDN
ncbi:MAG TPA: ABC transporter ATP-binding protein [Acidimicrobiales bacterium]